MSLSTSGSMDLTRLGFTGTVANPPWLVDLNECALRSQEATADVRNVNNSTIASLSVQSHVSLDGGLNPPAPLPGSGYAAYFEIVGNGVPSSNGWFISIGIGIRSSGVVELAASERFASDFSTLADLPTTGLSGAPIIGQSGCITGMTLGVSNFAARGLTFNGSMSAQLNNVFPCQSVDP